MTPAAQALVRKFPIFFDHPDSPSGEGRPGIMCEDGWLPLLDALLSALAPLQQSVSHLSNPPRLYEIGKRRDRLRILLRPMTPEMATMVYETADRSALVCERCGGAKPSEGNSSLCEICQNGGSS